MVMQRVKAIRQQKREQLIQAYQIGAFVGFSKLPPLDKLLQRLDRADAKAADPPPTMSEAEIMHTMSLWAAAMRGQHHQHH